MSARGSRISGWAGALCAVLAMTGAARPARAQSADDKAAAEALFDDGKKLFLAKKFAEACPKLEASQKLDPGIGTLLYLADCYEGLGRVASAWATFREAAGLAKTAGQGERERVARARAAKLEPKLYKLSIAVSAEVPGLEIKRSDAVVKKETWGAALPVDPGAYTISASAPGKKPWSTQVQIPEGAGAKTITIPALEDAPAEPTPPPPPPLVKAPDPTPAPPPPPPPSGLGAQRIVGITIGAVGVVTLGIGGAFGGLAIAKNSTAKSLCPNIKCTDQTGVDASKAAGQFADAATGLLVAGGVLAAGGLVLVLTAPSNKAAPKPEKAWIAPAIAGGFAGVAAGRTW